MLRPAFVSIAATAVILGACQTTEIITNPPALDVPDAASDAASPDVASSEVGLDAAPVDSAAPDVSANDADDVSVARDVVTPPADVPLVQREAMMPPQRLTPGQEVTLCREVRLGNPDAMLVRRIHVSIPRGSHHLIVYRSNATAEQPTPTPCRGLSGILSGTAPIYIAQQPESGIDFPDGVGLTVAADQMIRLEEHFINTTAAPLDAGGRVTFDLAPAAGLTRADMMFWGTQNINVPARSRGRAQYFHAALTDINVFGLTSHTHEFGELATVEVATSLTGAGREVHRSMDWAEPPLTRFAPPLTFAPGEGLRLVCSYNNTSDRPLTFGESFYQEMCFLWAYYYPSQGFHVCFDGICRALQL